MRTIDLLDKVSGMTPVFCMFVLLAFAGSVYAIDNPIVYSSAPRDMRKVPNHPDDLSGYHRVSEVAAINGGFQESDLEIKLPDGRIETIYNCTGTDEICGVMEARVSPDASKIIYSKISGGGFDRNDNNGILVLSATSGSNRGKLYLYDLNTKKGTLLPNQDPEFNYRMADWVDDDTIVYASDLANVWGIRQMYPCTRKETGMDCYVAQDAGTGPNARSMQIWRMNLDGTDQRNLTPHEGMAIRPTVFRHPSNKGRVAYSSWQIIEDKMSVGTQLNNWWIMTIDENGGSGASLLGAHRAAPIIAGPWGAGNMLDEIMALRSIGEDSAGTIYVTNYYRGNHGGLGKVYGLTPQLGDFQVEGCLAGACVKSSYVRSDFKGSGQYVPHDLTAVTVFGSGLDNPNPRDSQGRATGKTGFPAPLENGNIMVTWGQGLCSVMDFGGAWDGTNASLGGQPYCDKQIVELLKPQVSDPFDPAQLRVLVNDPLKHEWDAQEIVARPVTHVQPPLDPAAGCFIEVADIRNAELWPTSWRLEPQHRHYLTAQQGNSVKPHDQTWHKTRVRSLAIYGIKLHSTSYPDARFVNALNWHGAEDKWFIGKQDMMADGSVRMQIPCDTPFQMSAFDEAGKAITHDPMPQSLRPGETRTCFGCHDGHSRERRLEIGVEPKEVFKKTLAYGTNPPLVNGAERVSVDEVQVILEKSCGGCHTGFQKDEYFWYRVFYDINQTEWPWIKSRRVNYNGQPWLYRPHFSPLASRYADWSPLYWYIEGKRTDGYTNADFTIYDVDYLETHPAVEITEEDKKKVLRYIDLGAPKTIPPGRDTPPKIAELEQGQ